MKKQASIMVVLAVLCAACVPGLAYLGWVPAWFGADFLIVSIAYFSRTAGVFGKRPDGTLPAWSWVLFGPFFAFSNLVWNFGRLVARSPACNTVSPDLVIGRRLLEGENVGTFSNFVDLTAEFPEPRSFRQSGGYLNFPILDAGAPDPEALREAINKLRPGRTYVHCAQGYGRTGLFAVALLVNSGVVSSSEEGLRLLKSVRARVHLNAEQQRCMAGFMQLISKP